MLTKVDRIEPGGSAKWLKLMRNEDVPLPNGWFCVKQRDPAQLKSGVSWEDAKSSEVDFFTLTTPWNELENPHRSRLGSAKLSEHLAHVLSHLVSQE